MRFHLASADRARSAAKTLRKMLPGTGVQASLGQCQAAIAAALGYASWAELKAQAGLHPPSPLDHEAEAEVRAARLVRQVSALADSFSLDAGTAEGLARTLSLTGSRLQAGGDGADASPAVAGFLAGCEARVSRHGEGVTAVALMGLGQDRVLRYEALFRADGAHPSLTLWIFPKTRSEAADTASWLLPHRFVPDAEWNGCCQVLGFGPGPEERRHIMDALRMSSGSRASDVEVDQAVAGWRRLLREAGVRELDAKVDRSALALFDHASAPPPNARDAYEALRDAPANARMRSLVAAFPMLAREIYLDPAIRDPGGPADPDALAAHLAAGGLAFADAGGTGPLPRGLVDSFRGETGGGATWTPEAALATLRLARARAPDGWRWWAGERLKAYVALGMTFHRLQALWDEGDVLEFIGRDRLETLLAGPPWRPADACRDLLNQPDPDMLPREVSTALARAAILLSGEGFPASGKPRLDPGRHGAALLALLGSGTLGEALSRALLVIARESLGRRGAKAPVAEGRVEVHFAEGHASAGRIGSFASLGLSGRSAGLSREDRDRAG